ncbi:MAG TPA: YdhR family protein [Dongiaceae bacterium]|nr:YdhR family protein [Dongiaceae bacterium]
MITVITRFPLPVGVPAAQIRAGYEHVAPAFRNIPGLIRKQFLLSPDGRTGGGVYLWSDEAAARAFMEGKVAPMIREKFKVEPQIEYFESPVIVEG